MIEEKQIVPGFVFYTGNGKSLVRREIVVDPDKNKNKVLDIRGGRLKRNIPSVKIISSIPGQPNSESIVLIETIKLLFCSKKARIGP